MVSLPHSLDARAEPASSAGGAVIVVAALAVVAVVLFAPQVLNDGDTFWHLAAGQWMLDHGRVLQRDVFSYTAAGQPWVAHEWAADVLMALAFRAGGWSGLLVLFALAAGATLFLLGRRLRRDLEPLALACVLVLVFACMAPSLLARPHLLALPLLTAWTLGLMRARDQQRAPPLQLAAIMLIWANTHGGYVFGLALIAPFALEALLAQPSRWKTVTVRWGVFAAVSLAAAFVTPFGVSGLIYPFHILTMTSLPWIAEWRATDFSHAGPMEIALLASLFVMLHRGVRIPPVRLATLLLLLHMALQHRRHQIVLAVVGALLLAEPLGAALAGSAVRRLRDEAAATRRWALGGAVAALLLMGLRLGTPLARTDAATAPVTALRQVPAALAQQPVLNAYGFGGYLIWRGVRPFIDGRSDMFGDAFTQAFFKASDDPAALDALLARWKIAWTVFPPDDAAVTLLDHKPGWRRLYADRYAVVHVREDVAAGS